MVARAESTRFALRRVIARLGLRQIPESAATFVRHVCQTRLH
jgi:hypothetical protein